jgi:NAD(P)-dependent dehydrogenase (short-subunit alcohol dehydrogenase family)
MQIDGRTFLVAGGSSGLGAACVRRLAARGANIVIADVDPGGRALAEHLGSRATFAPMDVTDEASVAAGVVAGVEAFGGLDGTVVCAGVLGPEKVLPREGTPSSANYRRVIEINLVGTFNVIRHAANAIRDRPPGQDGERGVIITTGSIASDEGQIGQAAYAASKGGVAAMTLPIARELARHGIRIMNIAPGLFDTAMMASVTPELRQSLSEQVPFPPRFGDPGEFAYLVEHIVENPMLNGSTIRLDGAMRMKAK